MLKDSFTIINLNEILDTLNKREFVKPVFKEGFDPFNFSYKSYETMRDENEEVITFKTCMPGIKKDVVTVYHKDSQLHITISGSVIRTLPIKREVFEKIASKLEDGILTTTVYKRPKEIYSVEVK